MKKYIISERQLGLITNKLLQEAVGVPEKILDSGKKLYDILIQQLNEITTYNQQYFFSTNFFNLIKKLGIPDQSIQDKVFLTFCELLVNLIPVDRLEGADNCLLSEIFFLKNNFPALLFCVIELK